MKLYLNSLAYGMCVCVILLELVDLEKNCFGSFHHGDLSSVCLQLRSLVFVVLVALHGLLSLVLPFHDCCHHRGRKNSTNCRNNSNRHDANVKSSAIVVVVMVVVVVIVVVVVVATFSMQ